MQQKNKAITTICSGYGFLAERKGFEPLWLLTKRFSRPPRYDRFDTSPNIADPVVAQAHAPMHQRIHALTSLCISGDLCIISRARKNVNTKLRLAFTKSKNAFGLIPEGVLCTALCVHLSGAASSPAVSSTTYSPPSIYSSSA